MSDVNPIIAQIVPTLAKAFKDDILLRDFFTEISVFVLNRHDGATIEDTKMMCVPVNVPHAVMDYLESIAVPEGQTKEQLLGDTIGMLMRFGMSHMLQRTIGRRIVSNLANALQQGHVHLENPGGEDDDNGTMQ